jgi:hypothetical protein
MRFRFLAPVYVDGRMFNAGEVCEMRADFIPPGCVEPLDASAVQAFYRAGPQPLGLVRQQWSDLIVTHYPATYWKPIDAAQEHWVLTGLGAHLGSVKWTSDADPRAVP